MVVGISITSLFAMDYATKKGCSDRRQTRVAKLVTQCAKSTKNSLSRGKRLNSLSDLRISFAQVESPELSFLR
jgi:hypothetical protein